jgi:hypothetical protein
MTLCAAALLLLFAAATPSPQYFRYERAIQGTPAQKQQTCLTLDSATFTHAGPQLASLRVYNAGKETPYAINYAEPLDSSPKAIELLNAGLRNGVTTFDAAMPEGSYSDVALNIVAKDFIATVYVSGSQSQRETPATRLGNYTVFDFTRQKLGRSTVLHLPQSDFRYLHFRIDGGIRPDQITGLTQERLSQGVPQYVTVAMTTSVRQKGRDTIVDLSAPADVPVDRILMTPGAQPVNFSREASITVSPISAVPSTDAEEPSLPSLFSGNLLRIHGVQNGHKIDEEHLELATPYQSWNVATKWTIAIHNEDDAPLDIQSVSLQMVARILCFDAEPGTSYRLYYGDAALHAPHYDYAQLFTLDKHAAQATPGPEQQNPQYEPRPDTRPFTEKHPALLWIALIAAIFVLGVVAIRSSKQQKKP